MRRCGLGSRVCAKARHGEPPATSLGSRVGAAVLPEVRSDSVVVITLGR